MDSTDPAHNPPEYQRLGPDQSEPQRDTAEAWSGFSPDEEERLARAAQEHRQRRIDYDAGKPARDEEAQLDYYMWDYELGKPPVDAKAEKFYEDYAAAEAEHFAAGLEWQQLDQLYERAETTLPFDEWVAQRNDAEDPDYPEDYDTRMAGASGADMPTSYDAEHEPTVDHRAAAVELHPAVLAARATGTAPRSPGARIEHPAAASPTPQANATALISTPTVSDRHPFHGR